MKNIKPYKYKPLSFSTTMRNPQRIPSFLKIIKKKSGEILTNEVINEILEDIIKEKIYKPFFISKNEKFKLIYQSENKFNKEQIEEIIMNSPQNHKEAGFDKGWPSRFDTFYKLMKEWGLLYYKIGEKIEISELGEFLIKAFENEEQFDIFASYSIILSKYKTNNLYRKNLNSNKPLILLLDTIKKMRKILNEDFVGISRLEIPIFLCWKDDDTELLSNFIIKIRKEIPKNKYTKENIYCEILKYLDTNFETMGNYIKLTKIFNESTDEYIRKMRESGLISLRGMGKFIDWNSSNRDVINHILSMDSEDTINNEKDYFKFYGKLDNKILELFECKKTGIDKNLIEKKQEFLVKFGNELSFEELNEEFKKMRKKAPSENFVLKDMLEPTRLEFLTSVVFKKKFPDSSVMPNYLCDDEGIPFNHATGNRPDIVFLSDLINFPIEVTLISGSADLTARELFPIVRHLKDDEMFNKHKLVLLIAPNFYEDNFLARAFLEDDKKIKMKFLKIENVVSALLNMKTPNEVINL
ncbi:AlwI family type II restriction endonuclease [Spiroplasma cantharicola]|uniref:Uncharacterized protein n=1 Tax=Spiroplasma cantharicola TaxID=362837 RepID=A0A0M4JIY3_9MOLU|nr:AlwI family type II restriction endonuclease [Spiroplasma cantharicola]ALD66653.1 hypothetical protein SCANT_v1c07470 [Spiroplasma cantharicola]